MTPEQARRKTLIDAAEHEFLRSGYHATTMDTIAAHAGMSKKTVYQIFASKEALFRAVIAERRPAPMPKISRRPNNPQTVLTDLLMHAAASVLGRNHIAMCRLVAAGSLRSSRLARVFLESLCEPGLTALENGLTDLACQGHIRTRNTGEAARSLFALAIGPIHTAMLVGHQGAPARPELERRMKTAVALFLHGVASR